MKNWKSIFGWILVVVLMVAIPFAIGTTIDDDMDFTGITNFQASVADAHGAGAVGTAFAPRTYRHTKDGEVITSIHVDLTGLACKGGNAKDAIGLSAGGVAYIGRYVTATYGIVYKIEMKVLETPGEGTATITTDIDLGAEDVETAYDASVDDIVINTGGISAGQTYQTLVPSLTANDYIYLIEGDTAATTGVYNAGMLIITFYGHALLS